MVPGAPLRMRIAVAALPAAEGVGRYAEDVGGCVCANAWTHDRSLLVLRRARLSHRVPALRWLSAGFTEPVSDLADRRPRLAAPSPAPATSPCRPGAAAARRRRRARGRRRPRPRS